MRPIRGFVFGIVHAALWPGLLALGAFAIRQGPWPRAIALATGASVAMLALAAFAVNVSRWFFGDDGWARQFLDLPREVNLQARRAGVVLVLAHVAFLLPCWMLQRGMLAPGGRPVIAQTGVRGLTLLFELSILTVSLAVARPHSALFAWLTQFPERLGWLNRNRRVVSVAVIALISGVIMLDIGGYCFSARRLSVGMAGTLVAAGICWVARRLTLKVIDRHAWRWRWRKIGHALGGGHEAADDVIPTDMAARLRRLSGWAALGLFAFLMSWVWDVDFALFQFLGEQHVWGVDNEEVTVGHLTRASVVLLATVAVWRHMSTCFALLVFPRMTDDPGVRFAIVTLCRYAVLALGTLVGLSAVKLGMEQIKVVLAALGVGLGFGLQEIVSNFVCGIILLLERPIRVGDIVTVSGMTGKVDRIHIRATTIVNGDNQSIIVPNRAFITGDLVNWTLKDKVIRVTLRIKVAYGTDLDKVSDLLIAIARDDADVLRSPLPSAFMEELSDSSLSFVLHAHVPDPALAGRVRHRLFAQIQKRFEADGIQIPLPTQNLFVRTMDGSEGQLVVMNGDTPRADRPESVPAPHWHVTSGFPSPAAAGREAANS